MSLEKIFQRCGLAVTKFNTVSGGDINKAYCLHSQSNKFFLKTNSASSYPEMLMKEAAGLNALKACTDLKVPQVIAIGEENDEQYLLLEWIERGIPGKDFWQDFGSGLAQQHRCEQSYFGWEEDNYIGSLPQVNTKTESWHEFYSERRILPLAEKLFQSGIFSRQDLSVTEKLCNKLKFLFPDEKPALLHGDLWSGNFMISADGKAAVYDPAVYFGHREMDMGMSLLFGGFDTGFYDAYNEAFPLERRWRQRVPLTQLYPLLVHAVLFGGSYTEQARKIIKDFVR